MTVSVFKLWFRQILVLPILVVLLTSLGFLGGGVCATWQWWMAVAGAVVAGYDKNWKLWLWACGFFALTLLALSCLTHTAITRAWVDAQAYHLPAVRALIEGWNPIQSATPESLATFLGLGKSDARFWMMLSMPKSVWVLNAVAFFFTGDVFNVFFPAYFLILLPVMGIIWQSFRPWGVGCCLLACVLVICLVPSFNVNVDVVVALAGIGLLVSMWRVLRGYSPDWLALFAFSFWMSASKQTAALHCFVMWGVFALIWIRSWRLVGRIVLFAFVLAMAWGFSSISPFYTNWKHYGHPLYPCYTVNTERYPVIDLVQDFKIQNEDAAQMGRIGRFANAMISTDLTCWIYSALTGKRDFHPSAQYFGYDNPAEKPTSPTRLLVKLAYCSMVVLILVLGTRTERLLLCILLVASFAVPKHMIGYLRYTPWLFGGWLFVLAALASKGQQMKFNWVLYVLFGCCLLPLGAPILLNTAILIDLRYATNRSVSEQRLQGASAIRVNAMNDGSNVGVACGRLAARQYGIETFETTVSGEKDDFFTYEFAVNDLPPYSDYRNLLKGDKGRTRALGYFILVCKSVYKFFYVMI